MSNLRAGVQILIDQLASNPDEFFGPIEDQRGLRIGVHNGKFTHWRHVIENELLPTPKNAVEPGNPRTWFLTDEEKAALRDAYTEACKVRFDAEIVAALMHKPEEANAPSGFYITTGHPGVGAQERMRIDSNGSLGIGTLTASSLANSNYAIRGGQNER